MISFSTFLEQTDQDFQKLLRHPKWQKPRYEGMKSKGLMHHEIQKVWDDEIEAEKEAAKLKKSKPAGKK